MRQDTVLINDLGLILPVTSHSVGQGEAELFNSLCGTEESSQ